MGDSVVETISGRELHAYLSKGRIPFYKWMPRKVVAHRPVEGTDFTVVIENM